MPGNRNANQCTLRAAILLTWLAELTVLPSHGSQPAAEGMSPRREADADSLLQEADRLLATLDRLKSAAAPPGAGGKPTDIENFFNRAADSLSRVTLLNLQAMVFLMAKEPARPREAAAALAAAEEAAKKSQIEHHPLVLVQKAWTLVLQAGLARREKDSWKVWECSRRAGAHLDEAEKVLGRFPADWHLLVFSVKLGMAATSAAVLQSTDPSDLSRRRQFPLIVQEAFGALDSCERLTSALPEAQRDPEEIKSIAEQRAELRTLEAAQRDAELSERGDHDQLIADCNAALRLDPRDALALRDRGLAYALKGDYDGAIADFADAIRLDPKLVAALGERAVAYRWKGDFDKAIADCSEAIRLGLKDAPTYRCRGVVYSLKRQYEKAVADFGDAIRLDPRDAMAYRGRGVCYLLQGDNDRAIADCTVAIRLDPTYARAYATDHQAVLPGEVPGDAGAVAMRRSRRRRLLSQAAKSQRKATMSGTGVVLVLHQVFTGLGATVLERGRCVAEVRG